MYMYIYIYIYVYIYIYRRHMRELNCREIYGIWALHKVMEERYWDM